MASDAQIRANRANSQKSTGPRTQAGKDRSRLNATRHNITGTLSLRTGPEKDAFDEYFQRLLPDLEPENAIELELASRIIDVLFRLARVSVLEANIYAAAAPDAAPSPVDHAVAQAKTFIRESRTFSNLSLYEQRLSRTLHKDLDTLDRLQNPTPRDTKREKDAKRPLPRVTLRYDPPILSPVESRPCDRIGFVFSTPRPELSPPRLAA